jgi:chromate transport protein ChrA
MFGFSAANIAVALLFNFAIWALYSTFVPAAIIIVLFFVQYFVFKRMSEQGARRAGEKT